MNPIYIYHLRGITVQNTDKREEGLIKVESQGLLQQGRECERYISKNKKFYDIPLCYPKTDEKHGQ